MFQPRSEYNVYPDKVDIKDFFEYKQMYVVRPPYQRKTVWSIKKQQALLDSLFRNYYIPKLVLREVRLDQKKAISEVVDGQQRINTVQNFFADKLKLPETLRSVDTCLPGKYYSELPDEMKMFVDKKLKFDVDIIKDVNNPKSPTHQNLATEIFWRLQQGDALNFMEIAHARLSSLVRNFIVKYSDDISFDFEKYEPLDDNPDKHGFFRILDRNNDRMQNLSLMGRFLLIERAGGPTDVRDTILGDWIDETQQADGVGNLSFENTSEAQALLQTLNLFYKIFKDDPVIDGHNGVKELKREYFIISLYLLLRHLRQNYVTNQQIQEVFKNFTYEFHERWQLHKEDDLEIQIFQNNRQQSIQDLETRDNIIRQLFFEHLEKNKIEIKSLDSKRAFNEAERIRVYRKQDGLCQMCLAENKPPKEAKVSWGSYQTDHIIPWIKGGKTTEENAQVLCRCHNAQKGGR